MELLRKNWFIIGIFTVLFLGVAAGNIGVFLNRGGGFQHCSCYCSFCNYRVEAAGGGCKKRS